MTELARRPRLATFRRRLGWERPWRSLPWLLPVVVLYMMTSWSTARIDHVLAAVLASGLVLWAAGSPGVALILLAIFLPVQPLGLGLLLRVHVPVQLVRPLGGLKEALGLGLLVAAVRSIAFTRRRLDGIDKAALVYVAVVTLYLVVPRLFANTTPNYWNVRLLSWRADCGYVLLFFAARHAPISARARRNFVRALIGIGVLTVFVAVYQWARPAQYARFVIVSARQVEFQISVLHNSPEVTLKNLAYITNRDPLRVGSIFFSPFEMSDFLIIPLALAVERITRKEASLWAYVFCAGVFVALFVSRVRADAIAAVVILVIALAPAPKRPASARLRLLGAICIGAVIIVPSLRGTRFENSQGGAVSNQGHVREFKAGIQQVKTFPLGLGIGDVAGVGDRLVLTAQQQGNFTFDNSVLQVGDELGIQTMLPWIILVVLVWRGLSRVSREGEATSGGARLAFIGVLVAGQFHHVFVSFPVAWSVWALAGLALATARPADGRRSLAGSLPYSGMTVPTA